MSITIEQDRERAASSSAGRHAGLFWTGCTRWLARFSPLAVILCVFPFTTGATCAGAVVGGVTAGDQLDSLHNRVESVLGRATANGDYLLEKTTRGADLALKNAANILAEQRDTTLDRLSVQELQLLTTIESLVGQLDRLESDVLDLEDFIYLDIQNIISQIPFFERRFLLRRIDGFSLVHRESGVYTIRLIGNAFGPGFRSAVTIGGIEIGAAQMRSPREHVIEFDVNAADINDQFIGDSVNRIDLAVDSFERQKNSFWRRMLSFFTIPEEEEKNLLSIKTKLLLLPRHPIRYSLVEHASIPDWSDDQHWSTEGSAFCPRTNRSARGEDPHNLCTACAHIPQNALMLKETVSRRIIPEIAWGYWIGSPSFSNADKTVCQTFKHWIHDKDRAVYLKVKYREPSQVMQDRPVQFENDNSGALAYGTYTAPLSKHYQSYTLRLDYFNGRTVLLTPSTATATDIHVGLESLSNFKRLTVTLKGPR